MTLLNIDITRKANTMTKTMTTTKIDTTTKTMTMIKNSTTKTKSKGEKTFTTINVSDHVSYNYIGHNRNYVFLWSMPKFCY